LSDCAGGLQLLQTCARRDQLALNALLEDRAEEDEIGAVVAGRGDLGQCVAAHADYGRGQVSGLKHLADLGGGEFAGMGREVDAIGAGAEGHIGPAVHEEPGPACAALPKLCHRVLREVKKVTAVQMLLTKLDEVDAVRSPAGEVVPEPQPEVICRVQ
jgi:hypothetical protein